MKGRKPVWQRLALVLSITLILSLLSAIALVAGFSLQSGASVETGWSDFALGVLFFSGFAFIVIAACIPIAALPAVVIGQRKGWTRTLKGTLSLSVPLGLICALVTTGWWLGRYAGWPLLIAMGAGNGLLGGWLWWRWIGAAEAAGKGEAG